VSVVLHESQPVRLSAANPVLNADEGYYDDRIITEGDVSRYTVLLNGSPGSNQSDAMERLLERCEVLVRGGWRAE
jgi:hypothetical protein